MGKDAYQILKMIYESVLFKNIFTGNCLVTVIKTYNNVILLNEFSMLIKNFPKRIYTYTHELVLF